MDVETLRAKLVEHDKGVLMHGSHSQFRREFCVLEFDNFLRGREWSDTPRTLPDLRQINDGPWKSDEARTDALLPVMSTLWNWSNWSRPRKKKFIERLAIRTANLLLADCPGLSPEQQHMCRDANTLEHVMRAADSILSTPSVSGLVAHAARFTEEAAWSTIRANKEDEDGFNVDTKGNCKDCGAPNGK